MVISQKALDECCHEKMRINDFHPFSDSQRRQKRSRAKHSRRPGISLQSRWCRKRASSSFSYAKLGNKGWIFLNKNPKLICTTTWFWKINCFSYIYLFLSNYYSIIKISYYLISGIKWVAINLRYFHTKYISSTCAKILYTTWHLIIPQDYIWLKFPFLSIKGYNNVTKMASKMWMYSESMVSKYCRNLAYSLKSKSIVCI